MLNSLFLLLLTTKHPSEICNGNILSIFSLHVFIEENKYTPHVWTTILED